MRRESEIEALPIYKDEFKTETSTRGQISEKLAFESEGTTMELQNTENLLRIRMQEEMASQ